MEMACVVEVLGVPFGAIEKASTVPSGVLFGCAEVTRIGILEDKELTIAVEVWV